MYRRVRTCFVCLLLTAWSAGTVTAQLPPPADGGPPGTQDPLNVLEQLGGIPGGGMFGSRVEFSGSFRLERGTLDGQLSVHAMIQPGWHMYSTTQPSGGPQPTVINVAPSSEFQVTGNFEPDRDPRIHPDPAFPGVRIEEIIDEVTWTAPIRLSENVDPAAMKIQVTVDGQVCETGGSCDLIAGEPVEIVFAGFVEPRNATGTFKDDGGHVTITGHIEPKTVAAGGTVMLVLTAQLEPTWHVYRVAAADPKKVSKPTLIVLRKTSGWEYGKPESSAAAREEPSGLAEEPVLYCHEGTVSWTLPIQIPTDARPGVSEITGSIAYQTCTRSSCDLPTAADFAVKVTVANATVSGTTALRFSQGTYARTAKDAAARADEESRKGSTQIKGPAKPTEVRTVMAYLGIAFLAGLILNVMPCVLPVIGLKIMSFVQQAGGSRGEIFRLNLWFSLGLFSVFWVLAGAAAFANHSWGEHFADIRFLVAMIGIVFAFGLSFLGVWEIPIPGFVGSGSLQGAATKEGAVGAFSKGVLSTILATPCAGPLLVPAVSWAAGQPSWLTFLTFTSIGLGMATPYIVIGAFPRLINMLPKPGAWMDTFKQVMGFLLLATVVFLFSSLEEKWVIPTLTLLLGIGVGCWWIGKTPMTAELTTRLTGWVSGLAVIAFAAAVGFVLLVPRNELPWQPFSRVSLDQHLKEGRTVLIDFTANW